MLLSNLQSFARQLLKKVDHFLFQPKEVQHLAFFRICIALFCILQMLLIYPDLLNIFGEAGYLRRELSEAIIPEFQPRISWVTDYLNLHWGIVESESIYLFTYFFLFCLTSLLVGFFTRVMAIICFLMFSMYFGTGSFVVFGADCFALLSLFYCTLLPTGKAFSIDNLLFKRKPAPSIFGTFFVRLLRVHLSIVYVMAGLSKAVGFAWWNGEGVWRSAMIHYFNEVDISWLADFPQIAAFLSISVLILECMYPVFMSFKRTRFFGLVAVICMHLGIGIVMGLHLFAFIMIFWNITAFGWDYVEAAQPVVKKQLKRFATRIKPNSKGYVSGNPAI